MAWSKGLRLQGLRGHIKLAYGVLDGKPESPEYVPSYPMDEYDRGGQTTGATQTSCGKDIKKMSLMIPKLT